MSTPLQDLHSQLANVLISALNNGEVEVDKETGAKALVPASPAMLNVARQFLKDNDIKAMVVPESPLDKLGKAVSRHANTLPFEGSDEPATRTLN